MRRHKDAAAKRRRARAVIEERLQSHMAQRDQRQSPVTTSPSPSGAGGVVGLGKLAEADAALAVLQANQQILRQLTGEGGTMGSPNTAARTNKVELPALSDNNMGTKQQVHGEEIAPSVVPAFTPPNGGCDVPTMGALYGGVIGVDWGAAPVSQPGLQQLHQGPPPPTPEDPLQTGLCELYLDLLLQEEAETPTHGAAQHYYKKVEAGAHAHDHSQAHSMDIQLDFRECCRFLPAEARAALKKLDVDGNGKISTAEILHAAEEKRRLEWQFYTLVMAGLLVCGCIFGSALMASFLSQSTTVSTQGFLVPSGTGQIAQTVEATESIPLALAPLLGRDDLGRLQQVNSLG